MTGRFTGGRRGSRPQTGGGAKDGEILFGRDEDRQDEEGAGGTVGEEMLGEGG